MRTFLLVTVLPVLVWAKVQVVTCSGPNGSGQLTIDNYKVSALFDIDNQKLTASLPKMKDNRTGSFEFTNEPRTVLVAIPKSWLNQSFEVITKYDFQLGHQIIGFTKFIYEDNTLDLEKCESVVR